MLLGTDGVREASDGRGNMFGERRVRDLILLHHRESAQEIAARLEAALSEYRGDEPATDDVTFVVVKITGAA